MSDKDPNENKKMSTPLKLAFALAAGLLAANYFTTQNDTGVTDESGYSETYNDTTRSNPDYTRGPGPGPGQAPATNQGPTELAYSDFLDEVEQGGIRNVQIQEINGTTWLRGEFDNGRPFLSVGADDPELIDRLRAADIPFSAVPSANSESAPSNGSEGGGLLGSLLPIMLLIGAMYWISRRQMGAMGKMGGMGGNKAKLLTKNDNRVTFDDVAGIDEAKVELEEVVDFLRDPFKYQRVGAKMPTGVLLIGPPGTGKTLTARAVAGEADVPFYQISGSDFVEMFVGVGAKRVRDMFEEAKKNAPCIVFIDEIDAVGRKRGNGHGGGNDEREQTLNQILVEMDGFEQNDGVVIIAATNRPDVLDDALMRPGRFDRKVTVPVPDLLGRQKILQVHMRGKPMDEDIDVRAIANGTTGFSGADLANLVNEMLLLAVRAGKSAATMDEFNDAWMKVQVGYERKSLVMDAKEIERTAYHEIGHALVGMKTDPQSDPLHYVSVVPRGQTLGVTVNLPTKDQVSYTEGQLKAKLAMIFGGRQAESIIYGKKNITTGASNDIQQATNIATKMVTEWGFSEKVGLRRMAGEQQQVFVGQGGYNPVNIAPETQRIIDQEIQAILKEAEDTAHRLLEANLEEFELLTKTLLKYETLSGKEAAYIVEHNTDVLPLRDAELAKTAELAQQKDQKQEPQPAIQGPVQQTPQKPDGPRPT